MGVPNVVYKWKSLKTLYISIFVMNIAGCILVVIMIVSAVKLRMGVGQYLDMVVPGDANFWPGMMFLISFLCAPIYAIGTRLCFHLRFLSSDSLPRFNQVLFIYCALCFVSVIVVIGINTLGILRMINLRRINQNGIVETMQEYATEITAKVQVDMVQINFKCCGSKSFKDWFHVRWMQREGETPEIKNHNKSIFVSNDVPFSCCSTEMLQPCVHHNVLKPSEVYLYHPENRLTIATTGCHAKVLNHARYVGGLLIFFLILLAAYQMVLTLLSRLLQTAHSNSSYIGPRKDRYLAWILGSMPSTETYDRLVYEGKEVHEEMLLIRESVDSDISRMSKKNTEEEFRGDDEGRKKSLGIIFSKSFEGERFSSSTSISRKERAKLSTVEVTKNDISKSSTSNNSIPTPPPSPGTEDMIPERKALLPREPVRVLNKSIEDRRKRGKVSLSRVRKNQLKELRESLECLKKYESPWRGGSPIIEVPSSSPRQTSRVNICVRRGREGRFEKRRSLSPSSSSSSISSSNNKKHKVCPKDSVEAEDEMRMKKFCKDLSTEYKKSPYSKQRRDFSEQYKCLDSTHQQRTQDHDEGRVTRNEICAWFNPADTYSRFRGSNQDTMMRRTSQTRPGPPPIPIYDQRTVTLHPHCTLHHHHLEKPSFLSRPLQHNQPQDQIRTSFWAQQQKPNWGPRCPPAPTYFPISTIPLRPPRFPSCSRGGINQVHDQSRVIRPLQFLHNTESVVPRSQRCRGRHLPGVQPSRFSEY